MKKWIVALSLLLLLFPFLIRTTEYSASEETQEEVAEAASEKPQAIGASWADAPLAPKPPTATPFEALDWLSYANGLVAHAGGAIDGIAGTNSLESIEANYRNGHRAFEIDLNLTTDGVLVGAHDWPSYKGPLSWGDFASLKLAGRYTPLSFERIVQVMEKHEDMYIVTDTKSFEYSDRDTLRQFNGIWRATDENPDLRDRITVQIYNQEMLHLVKESYPFPHFIYTLYASPDSDAEVLQFMEDEELKVLVMPPERANKAFLDSIEELGGIVCLHTLNSLEEVNEWRAKGVRGFYTDFILPGEME
jgi:glycerophosphoryl diester phosphodiesterase